MLANLHKLIFGTSDEARSTFTDRWRARELGYPSRSSRGEALLSEAYPVY